MSSNSMPSGLMALKAKKAPPQIIRKTVKVIKKPAPPLHAPKPIPQARPVFNGTQRKDTTPRLSTTPVSSRHSSKEPIERIKKERRQQVKRPSPAASTPRFTSSDDDEEDEQPRKRAKPSPKDVVDPKRRIRDLQAFSEADSGSFDMIHAADIANSTIIEHSRDKYEAFFTALPADEDECPTIQLQHPSASQRERYQLVKPTDHSDFRPITEIFENMKTVAEHYVDDTTAERIFDEAAQGLYQKLKSALREGERGRIHAQSHFVEIVESYNDLIDRKRRDGTISKKLDSMTSIPLKLVEHIIKAQIYSRTVSPQVHLVRQYEGFSDNVYGELLPRFMSSIFKETRLKSDQTFVDLGSGVGNCVLQAALETGCESWGCEMMDNPHKLAELQAREFPARCRLWGIKPGPIHLIHDDFIKNEEISAVLKRADVVLINNQAFTAELNEKLKYKFLDLKGHRS
jgi:[histone H3]-lysine79 N-trimethyltransferase